MTDDKLALARDTQLAEQQSLDMLVQRDGQGRTLLVIPPELRERFLVFAPSAVLTEGDGMFRPGYQVIHFDQDKDFYVFEKSYDGTPKTYAMSKQGIHKVANGGGIDFSQDPGGKETGELLPVVLFGRELIQCKRYVYASIGRFRRSDGTWIAMRAEKEWHPQLEALQKEMEASKKTDYKTKQPWSQEKMEDYARKEFLRSFETRSMMMKSKAQNAVARAAYNIDQKYSPADIRKPGFVVTYNFSSGGTKEGLAIVAALAGADVRNLYGMDAPELKESPEIIPFIDCEIAEEVPAEEWGHEIPEDAGTAEAEDSNGMFAPVEESGQGEAGKLTLAQASRYRFPSGPYQDMPLGQVYFTEDERKQPDGSMRKQSGRDWLIKVGSGFSRLVRGGSASAEQRECLEMLEAYFMILPEEGSLPWV
jgi:hypothetical protein